MSHTLSFVNRLAVATLFLTHSLSAIFGQDDPAKIPTELPPSQTIERALIGAETHRYNIRLSKDEFLQIRVEQKGVDVSLRLLDVNGTVLATMDSPNAKQGPETLSFVAKQSGAFFLEVSGFDVKAERGNYSIHREAARLATAKDKRRVEVERLFVAGMTAQSVKGQTDIAIKRLSEAHAGWQELAEGYMAELTSRQIRQLQIPSEISAIILSLYKELETANNSVRQGQELSVKSKSDSLAARAKLNEALRIFRALKAKLRDSNLAKKIAQLGPGSQQTSSHLEALQLFATIGEATSLNAIGQTHYNLGELEEQVAYLKSALEAYKAVFKFLTDVNISGLYQKQTLFTLKSTEPSTAANLASTLIRLGKTEEALKYLNHALEQYRALYQEAPTAELKLQEALTLQQIGVVHTNTSKDRKTGIEFLSKANEIYRTLPQEKVKSANLLSLIGAQYSLDFNFEAALKNWDAAVEIYRALDDKTGQTNIYQMKGAMYSLLDNKTKVHENFNKALSILQSPGFAENYKKNHFNFTAGFEIYNDLKDAFVEYVRLDRIGFAYEMLEDYDKAIEHYEKALGLARAREGPADIRGELTSIGYSYTKLKKWDRAYEYYKQALEISRGGEVVENTADDTTRLGWTLLELGKPQDALRHLNEALVLYQSVGVSVKDAFTPRYTPLLNDLGRTHYALGNRQLAIFYGKQAVNSLQGERQRLRNFDAASQKGFVRKNEKHYRQLADWLIAEGRIPEAEQVLGMLKEEEIFDYVRRDVSEAVILQQRTDLTPEERDALQRYTRIADKIAATGAEFSRLQKLGANRTAAQEIRFKEVSKQVEDASYIFQAFLKRLAEEFRMRSNTRKDLQENLALQSDLKGWGKSVVFLYTLVGDDRYRVILVTPETQVDAKHEIKEIDLNKKIETFRQAVTNPRQDPRPLGKELYDILIRPIEKQLTGAKAKTLLWSLDGNLRLLPLAALWDGKQYFGEKYQNVIITLASRTRLGDAVAPSWRALALGVSEAKTVTVKELDGEMREFPFEALPAVKAELRSIIRSAQSPRGVLSGQSLIDAKFNKITFENQLARGYNVVHVASHFNLNPGDASRSFLLLGDGNVLTVDELRSNPRLTFSGVDLLTLSACQTAVIEKDSTGKEIEGFGYVAQQKGAKAILATLWSVADESTQLLMSEFYRLRKERPRLTKAAALQVAQQRMIQGQLLPLKPRTKQRGLSVLGQHFDYDPKKPFAHPFYWSPFILIGNWR